MHSLFESLKTEFGKVPTSLILLILLSVNINAQAPQPSGEQKRVCRALFRNEPFKIETLSVDGILFPDKNGTLIYSKSDSNDWLKDLSFSFRNTVERKIMGVHLNLAFPESQAKMPMLVFDFYAGKLPWINSSVEPLSISKDESGRISLSDTQLASLKNFVAGAGFPLGSLNQAQLRIVGIYYDDQTKWEKGYRYMPDPDAPGRYKIMPDK